MCTLCNTWRVLSACDPLQAPTRSRRPWFYRYPHIGFWPKLSHYYLHRPEAFGQIFSKSSLSTLSLLPGVGLWLKIWAFRVNYSPSHILWKFKLFLPLLIVEICPHKPSTGWCMLLRKIRFSQALCSSPFLSTTVQLQPGCCMLRRLRTWSDPVIPHEFHKNLLSKICKEL